MHAWWGVRGQSLFLSSASSTIFGGLGASHVEGGPPVVKTVSLSQQWSAMKWKCQWIRYDGRRTGFALGARCEWIKTGHFVVICSLWGLSNLPCGLAVTTFLAKLLEGESLRAYLCKRNGRFLISTHHYPRPNHIAYFPPTMILSSHTPKLQNGQHI